MKVLASVVAVCGFVGCGSEASPSGAPDESQPFDSLPTVSAEPTTAPSTQVDAQAPTTVAVTTTVSEPGAEAIDIHVEGYRIEVVVPDDAESDPLGNLEPEGSVVANQRWMTECCWLSVTVQNERPRFPDSQLLESVDVNGLEWNLHDAGGEDGTEIDAITTVGDISVTVASQDRFPTEEAAQSSTELVRSVAETALIEER